MRISKTIIVVILYITAINNILAQEPVSRPDSHGPIGVMGDHTHSKGEFMFSYRFMTMPMKDSRIGTDEVSQAEIISVLNRFSGITGQPPTLRVVPLQMNMNMHMIGAMYAPTDQLTIMGMSSILSYSMDHVTYQGGMGSTVLGEFETKSSGFGDTRIVLLYQLAKGFHANLGVSLPTGALDNEDEVLAPNGMMPTLRLPYPMQVGSGTFDILPALTYTKEFEIASFGIQANGNIRLGENENDYTLGNQFQLTSWGSYVLLPWLSSSLRLAYVSIGEIDGIDPDIVAPVQTANPDFQGGNRLDALLGINLIGQNGFIRNHRLAMEFGLPVWQDLNGPQLQISSILTLGWQYAL